MKSKICGEGAQLQVIALYSLFHVLSFYNLHGDFLGAGAEALSSAAAALVEGANLLSRVKCISRWPLGA